MRVPCKGGKGQHTAAEATVCVAKAVSKAEIIAQWDLLV